MIYYSSNHPNMPQIYNGDPWGTLSSLLLYLNNINNSYSVLTSKDYNSPDIQIQSEVPLPLVAGQSISIDNNIFVIISSEDNGSNLKARSSPTMNDYGIFYSDEYAGNSTSITQVGMGFSISQYNESGIIMRGSQSSLVINDSPPYNTDIYTAPLDASALCNPPVFIGDGNGNGNDSRDVFVNDNGFLSNGNMKWNYQRSNTNNSTDLFINSKIKWHVFTDSQSLHIFFENPNEKSFDGNMNVFGYSYVVSQKNDNHIVSLTASYQDLNTDCFTHYSTNNEQAFGNITNIFAGKPRNEVYNKPNLYNPSLLNNSIYNDGSYIARSCYMGPYMYSPGYSGNTGHEYQYGNRLYSEFSLYDYDTNAFITTLPGVHFSHNKNMSLYNRKNGSIIISDSFRYINTTIDNSSIFVVINLKHIELKTTGSNSFVKDTDYVVYDVPIVFSLLTYPYIEYNVAGSNNQPEGT